MHFPQPTKDYSAIGMNALLIISKTVPLATPFVIAVLRLAFACKPGKWRFPRFYGDIPGHPVHSSNLTLIFQFCAQIYKIPFKPTFIITFFNEKCCLLRFVAV